MKPMSEIDFKELKIVVKELNDSGLIAKKIKLVGLKNEDLIKNFTEVIESLDEEVDIPQSIANFYNDLYADEVTEDGDEIEDPEPEDEVIEDEIEEEVNYAVFHKDTKESKCVKCDRKLILEQDEIDRKYFFCPKCDTENFLK